MIRIPIVSLFLTGTLFLVPLHSARSQAVDVLDLPVRSSPAWKSIALSDALGQLGSYVQDGFILFGLEENLQDGKEPRVDFEAKSGTTLRRVLRDILAQLPPYEMEVVSSHLVDLRPAGAKGNTKNPLNLRVPDFDVISRPVYGILGAPRRVIPELDEVLTPKAEPGKQAITLYFGGADGGPRVTLHLKNVSVREILNAASVASEPFFAYHDRTRAPAGWVYCFNPNPSPGNSGHSWKWNFTMPADWMKPGTENRGHP